MADTLLITKELWSHFRHSIDPLTKEPYQLGDIVTKCGSCKTVFHAKYLEGENCPCCGRKFVAAPIEVGVLEIEEPAWVMAYPELSEERCFASAWVPSLLDYIHRSDRLYYKLFFHQKATRQILEHVYWGNWWEGNCQQQPGLLYGYRATDAPASAQYSWRWSMVCGIIAARPEKTSALSVTVSEEERARLDRELEQINAQRARDGARPYRKLGWFNTHPGIQKPFLDDSSRKRFPRTLELRDEQYYVVLSPFLRQWAAYAGPECKRLGARMELDDEMCGHPERFRSRMWLDALKESYPGDTADLVLSRGLELYYMDQKQQREQLQADAQPAQAQVAPAQAQDAPAEAQAADTCLGCADGSIAPVQEGRYRVLRESCEGLLRAAELLGGDCEAAVVRQETDAGTRLQLEAAYRRGRMPRMSAKDVDIVRFVPREDWPRAIREHYKGQSGNDELWGYLLSEDGGVCILRPVSGWGGRYVR